MRSMQRRLGLLAALVFLVTACSGLTVPDQIDGRLRIDESGELSVDFSAPNVGVGGCSVDASLVLHTERSDGEEFRLEFTVGGSSSEFDLTRVGDEVTIESVRRYPDRERHSAATCPCLARRLDLAISSVGAPIVLLENRIADHRSLTLDLGPAVAGTLVSALAVSALAVSALAVS